MLKVPLHWSFSPYLHELWSKERARIKLGYLTPNHKSLQSKGQMRFDWNMVYIVGKDIFQKIYNNVLAFSKKTWIEKDMNVQSFGTTKVPILGLPFGNPRDKWHLDITSWRGIEYTMGRGVVPPPKGCGSCKAFASCCPYLVHYTISIKLTPIALFSWLCRLISSWTLACEFVLVPS
jgi:hypothetical protein